MNDPQLRHNPTPTSFLELNDLLRELTERAAESLGDNFVGAYLQGSLNRTIMNTIGAFEVPRGEHRIDRSLNATVPF